MFFEKEKHMVEDNKQRRVKPKKDNRKQVRLKRRSIKADYINVKSITVRIKTPISIAMNKDSGRYLQEVRGYFITRPL